MKTIGMLSGTETIAQKFESGPMARTSTGAGWRRSTCGNLSHVPLDSLTARDRSCQEVASLLSGLQQRELNAGRKSRHPRSRERQLHLVEARHPLARGVGRD